jgi:hypothetical protein
VASHLSPNSAYNVLHDCKWTQEGTLTIVKGIINLVHACQTEHKLKVRKLESDICHLCDLVASYEETFNMALEGFELATDSVSWIQIPIGHGFHHPAKWVKCLNNGCMACFHEGQGEKDTPYIAKLYAPANYNNKHPLEPLKPWLHHAMSGGSMTYSMLLKEVNNLWEWGLQAEVEHYWKLDREIRCANDQIKLLHSDLKALQTHQHLCKSCLVVSHLQDKVGHLTGWFAPYPRYHHPTLAIKSGWRATKKGKGQVVTEDPGDE